MSENKKEQQEQKRPTGTKNSYKSTTERGQPTQRRQSF